MGNSYFRFKQFTVYQDRCAMKVCTDSCILGAYAALTSAECNIPCENILDIGGGTGLLSLMLAQKIPAQIEAVELNHSAYLQMRENFALSPWREKLLSIHTDIRSFAPETGYNLIISNPPFFENDLKASRQEKNDAKHDSGLRLAELFAIINKLLNENGKFMVLLPHARTSVALNLIATQGLKPAEILEIRQTAFHEPFRSILTGKKTDNISEEIIRKHLAISTGEGYTKEFAELLKDYYLKL